MRLFVALWPSADAVAHLDSALDELRHELGGLHWQRPERWHLTVTFLGEVADDRVPSLVSAIRGSAERHAVRPDLRLAGAGTFGRVVWVGVAPQPAPVAPLAADLARSLRAAGADVERRRWTPHLTVARARADTPDVQAARDVLAAYGGPSWAVTELTLVRSTTGPSPDYTVLERVPLGG